MVHLNLLGHQTDAREPFAAPRYQDREHFPLQEWVGQARRLRLRPEDEGYPAYDNDADWHAALHVAGDLPVLAVLVRG